jgi:DNA modification methylase
MTFTKQIGIDDVELDPDNVMDHDDANLDAIKASIERFGGGRSIVIDSKDVVRAGNGTVEAARAAGIKKVIVIEPEPDELVAVKRGDWSEQEAKGYEVADNRASQLAKFNLPALQNVINSIPEIDPEDMGFGEGQLDALFQSVTESMPQDDVSEVGSGEGEVPDLPASPVTQQGDVWLLGRHRFVCGDSRQLAAVKKLCVDKVHGVITDPPYGIDYQCTLKRENDSDDPGKGWFRSENKREKIQNDTESDDLEGLLRAAFTVAMKLTEPGSTWYVTGPSDGPAIHFVTVLSELGVWRQSLVWVKDSQVFGRRDYHYQHETIYYGWTPGGAHKRIEARDRSTVWQFDRPKQSKEHPTMKPVALFAAAINDTMPQNATIYDPFLGSGTTLIACEEMARVCVGLELEPKYCDVIVERWENLTGDKAQRVSL